MKVERLDVKISGAQGLLYAFDSLYLSVNGGPGSGLYRARDTDGDDQYDEVVKLMALHGAGEHGPHALRLSPDGKSILIVCGNHTDLPPHIDASRVPRPWDEDLLLPRQWDANGHARGRMAPGGWIAKTDPDGKTWEIVSAGYRNSYDFDLQRRGRAVRLRRRHGVGYRHALVSPDAGRPRHQRQRVRLAERHGQVAGVLPGQPAADRRHRPRLARGRDLRLRR